MTIIQQLEKRKKQLSHLNSPSNEEVYTPVALVEEMLDKLPKEIWTNPDLLWCDPCAKSGVFILEVIIRLMKNLAIEDETLKYNHIINNMVRAYVNVPRNRWIVSKTIYGSNEEVERVGIIEDINKLKIEEMPKFDVVVGNPPYKRNLHLKFLKLAYDCLNENGKIVWLHPARWLQDPIAPMKKNSDFNNYSSLPFTNFEIIPCGKASPIFKNEMTSDIVISNLEKNKKTILTEDKIYELRSIPITFKRLLHMKYTSMSEVIEKNKRDGVRIRIKSISPNTSHGFDNIKGRYSLLSKQNEIIIDGKIEEKDWTECIQKNQFSKPKGNPLPLSIKFDTLNEAQNFIKYLNTNIFLFFNFLTKLDVNVQLDYLPFMNDYTKEWTDKKLQKYFEISDEEMDFIISTIEKYK